MIQHGLRQADYISHMLEAASLAQSYVEGLNKADFLLDKRTQQAVILNIMVIGEAATKLADEYPEFISRFPQVQWKKHARHAQPLGSRLLRHQSGRCLGNCPASLA